MSHVLSSHGTDLIALARISMREHGFEPDFPPEAATEVVAARNAHTSFASSTSSDWKDLRDLLWSSIDNDTSRDLDQIEYTEKLPDGRIRVLVGIADVDATVKHGSVLDHHAERETTTVYAGVVNFPMLPVELSEDLTSLAENKDRASLVIEYTVDSDGKVADGSVYRALVRNRAQLAYNSVGPWLEKTAAVPAKVDASTDLQQQLQLQDEASQRLKRERHANGALNFETIEIRPVMSNNEVVNIAVQQKNRATQLIEEFMVAANGVVARTLSDAGVASIRRVVRTPKRWDRIVALAEERGFHLPAEPDSKTLNEFLLKQRGLDPDRFPDLSLAVVKLMGPGEYVLEQPGGQRDAHFGLAVEDYTHSTAPNRRFADLVTHRLLKTWMSGRKSAYSEDDLKKIAENCTAREDGARKVEREMSKRIAAVALRSRIGQSFSAIVTGVNEHGTFVRALDLHVEGMLVRGAQGLDVGDRTEVKLVGTDPQKGFIDFAR